MKIVVLAGGLSPERTVSLSSGTMAANAFLKAGHQAVLLDLFFGMPELSGSIDRLFENAKPLIHHIGRLEVGLAREHIHHCLRSIRLESLMLEL